MFSPYSLLQKTLECRYKLRTRAIRSLNIRRDRRPRLSVSNRIFIFFHPKQKMDMVRHYYTFLNRQMIIETFICLIYLSAICPYFVNSGGRTGRLATPSLIRRYAPYGDACPYNARKDTSFILCANRYKVYTATTIIKTLISWCFSLF